MDSIVSDTSIDTLPLEEVAVNKLNPRTIAREGSFLVPYLQPGMKMLDVGCGNGSMAHGFAEYIYPGEVVGIDNNEAQISSAIESLQEGENKNLEFRLGDIYDLACANESFDVVFAHNVFIHLSSPEAALKELGRVCKPGGIIGLRDGLANQCHYSAFPLQHKYKDLSEFIDEAARLSNGTPDVGIKMKGLLSTVGFSNLKIKVYSEVYDKAEDMQMLKSWYIGLLSGWMGELAIEHELVSNRELENLLASINQWDSDPAAINIITWIEHVGRKI